MHIPTRILFGVGALEELASTPHLPRGNSAMIVIGQSGAMIEQGYLARVQGCLAENRVKSLIFDKIRPNPETDEVDEAAALAREMGVDFVLGLGGGSTMDSAKAIALTAANGGRCWDYAPRGSGRGLTPAAGALPVVEVPTTAGTGSEADPWAVITKSGGPEKIGFGFDSTFPHLSVVDPELTVSSPPKLTALTGMDAFFHAVETFLSTKRQPLSDMLALEAVNLITRHLPGAVSDGQDMEARTALSWAATAGGLCLSLGRPLSQHSIEHAMSAHFPDIPHGAGLVMLSRAYFAWLGNKRPERFDDLAAAMGLDKAHDLPESDKPRAFLDRLADLVEASNLAGLRMSDYGIRPEHIPAMAETAFTTMGHLFETTPAAMTEKDVVEILEAAYA
ncbi:MAG: iron-containing alcohol dehydrogenase [Desulfovibrionaceae bacterium]|nr:iron-containing alcohol dehydrogenase [Desulfovibrionaceae bacterium]